MTQPLHTQFLLKTSSLKKSRNLFTQKIMQHFHKINHAISQQKITQPLR